MNQLIYQFFVHNTLIFIIFVSVKVTDHRDPTTKTNLTTENGRGSVIRTPVTVTDHRDPTRENNPRQTIEVRAVCERPNQKQLQDKNEI